MVFRGEKKKQNSVEELHFEDRDSGGSDGKESACNVEDLGSIPGVGRSSGEGNDNPLQYSCLENPMDGGMWWATVHGVAKCTPMFIAALFTVALTWKQPTCPATDEWIKMRHMHTVGYYSS